jgi:hypothetical protein
MVREVAIQHPLKPRTNHRHRFVPSLVELVTDRGQRCSHTLLGRQSHDLELPLLVRPTTVRLSRPTAFWTSGSQRSVRNTALCSLPPRYRRSGTLTSSARPSQSFKALLIGDPLYCNDRRGSRDESIKSWGCALPAIETRGPESVMGESVTVLTPLLPKKLWAGHRLAGTLATPDRISCDLGVDRGIVQESATGPLPRTRDRHGRLAPKSCRGGRRSGTGSKRRW